MSITVTIPHEELEEAWNIVHIIKPGETRAMGQVRLQCDGTQRRWSATDSIRAAQVIGGIDSKTYSIGIPPLVLGASNLAQDSGGDVTLTVDTETNTLVIEGGQASFTLPTQHHDFPDVDGRMLTDDVVGAEIKVRAEVLFDLVKTAMILREYSEDEYDEYGTVFPAPFWIFIDDGKVGAVVDWKTVGQSRFQVNGENARGSRYTMVNPHLLKSIIRIFDQTDELTFKIPTTVDHPISLDSGSRAALLMPLQTRMSRARQHVEKVLTDEFGHLAAIMDEDGDYPISRHGSQIFGRLVSDDDVPVFRLFALLLEKCEPTEELLREINDLNTTASFVRLFVNEDVVIAEADVVAEFMTPNEVSTAAERVWTMAQNVIPTLAAVLGGTQFEDPLLHRLEKYRTTIVEAEVFPGTNVLLNGPDAIEEWPFPGPVHVVTAWYPEGVGLSEVDAADINRQIAKDILAADGRFVLATGRPSGDDRSEPSLVAWNIEREKALEIANAACRDAVLEIDADHVHLLTIRGDITESWPRR
jgi:hypothetical protein